MKLERIQINRFGAWQNLELPVDSEGISVYFGPNEAGKSTLMRFVRGVLYGFRENDVSRADADEQPVSWGGLLQVEHRNRSWMIERSGPSGARGGLRAWPADDASRGLASSTDAAALVAEIVDGVTENVYENIFAIGLYELQELATLESSAVAEQIYSLSLGLDGQELLRLMDDVKDSRDEILNVADGTGRIPTLYEAVEKIDRQLDQQKGVRKKYEQLREEQDNWEETIVELKDRQQGLESQLHGHEYMERVHEPWRKVRDLERELAALPALPDFPEDGLASLQQIESELAAIKGRSNALRQEARDFRGQADGIEIDPNVRRYAPALQSFVDQREWIGELVEFAERAGEDASGLRAQLNANLAELGTEWSAERLATVDLSHVSGNCLSRRGREFRQLEQRNDALKRRYRKLSQRFHRRQEKLELQKKQLRGVRLADAIEQTRDEIAQLEDLSRLRIREAELAQRRVGIANQLERIERDPMLPEWVYATFAAIGVSGLVLGLIGVITGFTTNGIAGIGYALLGLLCSMLTYSLKRHFEAESARTRARLQSELNELDIRIVECRRAADRIAPSKKAIRLSEFQRERDSAQRATLRLHGEASRSVDDPGDKLDSDLEGDLDGSVTAPEAPQDQAAELRRRLAESASRPSESNSEDRRVKMTSGLAASLQVESRKTSTSHARSEADLLRECFSRLNELEAMVQSEQWVEKTRHRLIAMRQQLRDTQRDFGAARQNWTSHLVEQGLDETVVVDDALVQRDLVARSALLVQRIQTLEEDLQLARRMHERLRKRIEELGHRLQRWNADYSKPVPILDHWEDALSQLAEQMRERRRLKREAKLRLKDASKYRDRIRRLTTQRDAILVRGGAIDRDDFERRAELLEERFELNERLNRARQELSTAAAGERSMAIVESDLEAYDYKTNAGCMTTIREELDDLAIDLEDAFENLGRFKREIELLEQDRTSAELRFDREQTLSQITELAEEWFSLDWSVQTLESLRIDFERNHQPPILARAKEYLHRLSGGRYMNIWTPLGQRTLCVDDRDGNTLMVENLSGGTREQLFLAIRLALIEHFSQQGVELPVVLDDILVNFDLERTQAAVQELMEQVGQDQQILFFTCHQHLAEMFRQRGVGTVTLPDRRALSRERLAG